MYNLNEIVVDYRCKWMQHLFGMNNTGIPSQKFCISTENIKCKRQEQSN